jgi:DNA processing protein
MGSFVLAPLSTKRKTALVGPLQSVILDVVGTRGPTAYRPAAAERRTGDLAQTRPLPAAQRSALSVGGDTLAVFGCGVDLVVYPRTRIESSPPIAEKGLLVSEFPMGSPAYPQNFPPATASSAV